MPELPDITLYVERARERLHGQLLSRVRILNPFVLRTALPAIVSIEGRRVEHVQRLGKRVVLRFAGVDGGEPLYLVIHLMIAGRLRWEAPGAKPPARIALASFEFSAGTLVLTEAGTKRRASLHLVEGDAALATLDPGGVEIAALDAAAFGALLQRENHTVKRSLTDPRLFSGIGNSYSDEILHRARMSPTMLTRSLDVGAIARLHAAALAVLGEWTDRLRAETCTPATKPTTARAARPVAACSPTARSAPCSRRAGRGTSTTSNEAAGSRRLHASERGPVSTGQWLAAILRFVTAPSVRPVRLR